MRERMHIKLSPPDLFMVERGRPFDKFTERARRAVHIAHEEAARRGDHDIAPGYLLLGLSEEGDGLAARTLRELGADRERVRAAVEAAGPRDEDELSLPGIFKTAVKEARSLGHPFLGTEHLLLALLRVEERTGSDLLRGLGVTYAAARDRILALLTEVPRDADAGPGRGGEAGPKGNVVMCRLDDSGLAALDTLIEAGVCATRSEAAAWLIGAGIEARSGLFEQVAATVAEIRRLRGVAQDLARRAGSGEPGTGAAADSGTPEQAH